MALNNFKCNHLMPLHFKGLNSWSHNSLCPENSYTSVNSELKRVLCHERIIVLFTMKLLPLLLLLPVFLDYMR